MLRRKVVSRKSPKFSVVLGKRHSCAPWRSLADRPLTRPSFSGTSTVIPTEPPAMIRAAQYVRMSTEHQKYSTENQGDAIARYATQRNFELVRTYADHGKSGLRLDGRDAL